MPSVKFYAFSQKLLSMPGDKAILPTTKSLNNNKNVDNRNVSTDNQIMELSFMAKKTKNISFK